MIEFEKDISLKSYNTFGIEVKAQYFIEVFEIETLRAVLGEAPVLLGENWKEQILWLGGGSNILFTKNFPGLVVKLSLSGIWVMEETDTFELVRSMAGEEWHDFVTWTLQRDLGGLENLSLIPGNVGTAPIQNIGAYGVEVADSITQVEALDITSGEIVFFSNSECFFGYRDSFFKKGGKGNLIIIAVHFRLNKNPTPNTSYGAIQATLSEWGIDTPDIHDVSRAVITIRQSKLPDPSVIGNSGSFFKNPVVSEQQFKILKEKDSDMPSYVVENGVKIPAGYLIEKIGFKGYREGDAGVHEQQALVLVNYGKATGEDIHILAQIIISKVKEKYGIVIFPEVNIY